MTVSKPEKHKKDSEKSKSHKEESVQQPKLELLLHDFDKLCVKSSHYTPIPCGYSPSNRPLKEHLNYSYINMDKPANPSSHEVVAWTKKILKIEKTGHSGTLDPQTTGCLIVCLNRGTRLAKAQQAAGKEYVSILKLHTKIESKSALLKAMNMLKGPIFQMPPAISAVKKRLRIREIYDIKLLEFNEENNMAAFWCSV